MARAHVDIQVRREHVVAAAQLLQKSIIQTERDDIDLDEGVEEEEVGQVGARGGLDANTASVVAAVLGGAGGEQSSSNADTHAPAATVVDGDVEMGATPAVTDAATPAPPSTVQREKVKMKAEDYLNIAYAILAMLKERSIQLSVAAQKKQHALHPHQPDGEDGTGEETRELEPTDGEMEDEDEEERGMTMGQLKEWYLESIESSIQTEEDYLREQTLIQKVIQRMIRKERFLLPIYESGVDGDSTMESSSGTPAPVDGESGEVSGGRGGSRALTDATLLVIHPSLDMERLGQLDA